MQFIGDAGNLYRLRPSSLALSWGPFHYAASSRVSVLCQLLQLFTAWCCYPSTFSLTSTPFTFHRPVVIS